MVTPTRSQQDNFLRADGQEPAILSRKRHKELNCFLAGGFCDLIPIHQTDDHSWFHFTVASLEWHANAALCWGDLHHLVEWDSVKVPLSSPTYLLCHRACQHTDSSPKGFTTELPWGWRAGETGNQMAIKEKWKKRDWQQMGYCQQKGEQQTQDARYKGTLKMKEYSDF